MPMAVVKPSKLLLFDSCPCRFESRRCLPGTQPSSRHSYFKIKKLKIWVFIITMTKIILLITIGLLFIFNLACQSGTTPDANANSANTVTNIDQKNLPPGFSTVPITPSGNSTPGIPDPNSANVVIPSKGGTPIPGIPANPGKPLTKGPTPIPGIPDAATLKKQMNGSLANANASNPPRSNTNSKANAANRP